MSALALMGISLPVASFGATVTLTTGSSDPSGTHSFDSAGNWSDAAAPSSANDYLVTGTQVLRTAQNGGSVTFGGNSLTIGDGTTNQARLLYKGTSGTVTLTINNFYLNNATFQSSPTTNYGGGWNANSTVVLAGTMTIQSGGATFEVTTSKGYNAAYPMYSANWQINSTLLGSGTITVKNNASFGTNPTMQGSLILAGNDDGYTGAFVLSNTNTTLQVGTGGSLGSLGSASVTGTGNLLINRSGTLVVSGSIAGAITVTQAGSGTTTLNSVNTYTGATTISSGELAVNGSLAASSTVSIASGATLSGAGNVGGDVNSTGGKINGSGLTIGGSATLTGFSTLSGVNTMGQVTIASGSTSLTGTTNTSSSGTFSVSIGATLNNNGVVNGNTSVGGLLSGTGTIKGDLALSGTLTPGNSAGTTTITGNLDLATTAVVVIEVAGVSSHDQVKVSGNVNLAGTLDLSTLSGLTMGDSITLIDNTGTTTTTGGYFTEIITTGTTYTITGSSTTYAITIGGTNYLLNYAASTDGDNVYNDVTLSVVPEPSTWAMALGGIALLAFGQRMRRRSLA
ncbi:MAG: autotransporter-associated beta strand repeat-containing protein [Chthoniobacteraceae bacterium]